LPYRCGVAPVSLHSRRKLPNQQLLLRLTFASSPSALYRTRSDMPLGRATSLALGFQGVRPVLHALRPRLWGQWF
jgi:hypothetical protein